MTTAPAPTARPTLTVEIWSDLICPWCWIGKRRFDEALAAFAHADRVDVALRAYRLMPGQPVEPVEAMLAGKYRMSPAQVDQMLRQVSDAAASVGLRYDLPGTLVGDTLDGHRLVKLAEATGRAHALTERLYRAYFCEHGSLFDHAELTELAVEAGSRALGRRSRAAQRPVPRRSRGRCRPRRADRRPGRAAVRVRRPLCGVGRATGRRVRAGAR